MDENNPNAEKVVLLTSCSEWAPRSLYDAATDQTAEAGAVGSGIDQDAARQNKAKGQARVARETPVAADDDEEHEQNAEEQALLTRINAKTTHSGFENV